MLKLGIIRYKSIAFSQFIENNLKPHSEIEGCTLLLLQAEDECVEHMWHYYPNIYMSVGDHSSAMPLFIPSA